MRRLGETPQRALNEAVIVRSAPVSGADRLLVLIVPRASSSVTSAAEDQDRNHGCTQDEQHAQDCHRSNYGSLDLETPTAF